MYLSLFPGLCPVWEGWELGRSFGSLVVMPHSNFPRVTRMIRIEVGLVGTGIPRHSPYSQVFVVCTLGFCNRGLWDPEFLGLPLSGWHAVCVSVHSHGCDVYGTVVFHHVCVSQKTTLWSSFLLPLCGFWDEFRLSGFCSLSDMSLAHWIYRTWGVLLLILSL